MGAGAPAHGNRRDHRTRSFAGVVVTPSAADGGVGCLECDESLECYKPDRANSAATPDAGPANLACGNNNGARAFISWCTAARRGLSAALPYCFVIDNAPKRAVISTAGRPCWRLR